MSLFEKRFGQIVETACPECGRDVLVFQQALREGFHCGCLDDPESEEELAHAAKVRRRGLLDLKASRRALGIRPGVERAPFGRGRYRFAQAACEVFHRARPRRTLVLAGPSGLGKTTGAVAAVWNVPNSRFLSREVWCALSGWEPHVEAEVRAIIELKGIVVLDEAMVLGRERPAETEREIEVLFRIVRARHDAERGTILTTQLSEEDVLKYYHERGEAIVRRAHDGEEDGAPVSGGWIRCQE